MGLVRIPRGMEIIEKYKKLNHVQVAYALTTNDIHLDFLEKYTP